MSLSLLVGTTVPFVIKIFVLSIFEWPFYTGFTVISFSNKTQCQLGGANSLYSIV